MTGEATVLFSLVTVILGAGMLATRWWTRRRERALVKTRLFDILGRPPAPAKLDEPDMDSWANRLLQRAAVFTRLNELIVRSGATVTAGGVLLFMLALLALPLAIAFVFDLFLPVAVLVGAVLACAPVAFLLGLAQGRRGKFCEQLPDAIDLMISVLRSGLSVPQAVRAVGEEMPAPCGAEFAEVAQRMNLGQTLPDALAYSVERYQSFELDLIARATSIQLEVGGSLAELFDKTNATLRQRLKLKRQVRVLTAQSRLSGVIIAIMPFIIAVGFQIISPGYLRPLFETNVGRMFLTAAIVLQVIGILIIKRLSTFKV